MWVEIVIDMQNVYRPGQPWGCHSFDRACRNIRALLDALDAPDVYFTKFVYNPAASGIWAEYNRVNRAINENPWLNALADELSEYVSRYPVLSKSVYSSMGIPELRKAVHGGRRVVLTGVVSECCVLSTCMESIDMGLGVVYLRDACGGDDAGTERAVETILSRLPLHCEILNTSDYIRSRSPEEVREADA